MNNRWRTLLLATRNRGKLSEMATLLEDLPIEIRSVEDVGDLPEVEEDQLTLEGNALKKARVLHEVTGFAALADDTGLEVRALGGDPGVFSARFAGPLATDEKNRALLLERMAGEADRYAQFRTVVALVAPETERVFEGVCRGAITLDERGNGGFGYDAVFIPEGQNRTFAEMRVDEKNAISHRGRALREVLEYLHRMLQAANE